MNNRQRYFLKQKLIGLLMIAVFAAAVLLIHNLGWSYDIAVMSLLLLVPGLTLLFTREMIWEDEFKAEEEERIWKEQNERL